MRVGASFATSLSLLLGGACLAEEACKIMPMTESGVIGDPTMARLTTVSPGSDEVLIASADGQTACRMYVENSTNQYATSNGKYFIFDSSSGSSVRMIVWDWARCKAQDTIRSSSPFAVGSNQIIANSYCDCPTPHANQCTCYSAQVIRFGTDCAVSRDDKEAEKITMKQTGVPFLGKARIVNPGTPKATILSH
jgi:hypothetical protein